MLTRIPVSLGATACHFVNRMESETSAIARGLRLRDPNLLDRLIEQYQHRRLRYLVSLTGDRAIAENLFRKHGCGCWNGVINMTARHEFSTWPYTIARNLTMSLPPP